MEGRDLLDWGLSAKASKGIEQAYRQAKAWLTYYRPDIVVVERLDDNTRKGRHTQTLIETIDAAAEGLGLDRGAVTRRSTYANKYAEAAALAREYPQLEHWVPRQRRFWEPEPRKIIYFEALALAKAWMAQTGESSAQGDTTLV